MNCMQDPPVMTAAEFDAVFAEVSNWGRWDETEPRGTLNHLTPDRTVAAAGLVRSGITVSLGLPLDTRRRPDNPSPAEHRMTLLTQEGSGIVRFVKDYIGVDFHNDGHSHLDALCHVSFRGTFFGGAPDTSARADGATVGDVQTVRDGIVGRGVLLDIPRVLAADWVEPGEYVRPEELIAAEQSQRVTIGPGDILLVRTGHTRRLDELGPWDTTRHKAGLHPSVARLLAQREVAVLGCDTNSDTAPSLIEGVAFPMHVLAVNAMGLHLLDYLQLDWLARTCVRLGRWEFLCAIAPLRIPGGTGSPVNPIAVF
jgi:kynurenine formamidase